MYACTRVCLYRVCVNVRKYLRMCASMYVFACVSRSNCMYLYMQIRMYVCMYGFMQDCTCCVHACVYVCRVCFFFFYKCVRRCICSRTPVCMDAGMHSCMIACMHSIVFVLV